MAQNVHQGSASLIAEALLDKFDGQHPGVWRQIDQLRSTKLGSAGNTWMPRCFLPEGEARIIMKGIYPKAPHSEIMDLGASLATLASWRVTKGVFRMDSVLHAALQRITDTPDQIPVEVFSKLPQHWCLLLEVAATTKLIDGEVIAGVFVRIEHTYGYPPELHLMFLTLTKKTMIAVVPLQPGTTVTEATSSVNPKFAQVVSDAMVQLLYLCTKDSVADEKGLVPAYPRPQRSKMGNWLMPEAKRPKTWLIGDEFGAEMKRKGLARIASGRVYLYGRLQAGSWAGRWVEEEGGEYHLTWVAPLLPVPNPSRA